MCFLFQDKRVSCQCLFLLPGGCDAKGFAYGNHCEAPFLPSSLRVASLSWADLWSFEGIARASSQDGFLSLQAQCVLCWVSLAVPCF